MKIVVKRNEQPEVTIDLKDVHYPYAAIQLALEIEGYTKETIAEVFQMPEADLPFTETGKLPIPDISHGNLNCSKVNTTTNNMKQQTAVEWLIDRFLFAGYGLPAEWREQAKQMEKEQIVEAFYEGMKTNPFDPNRGRGKMYYDETYKKQ